MKSNRTLLEGRVLGESHVSSARDGDVCVFSFVRKVVCVCRKAAAINMAAAHFLGFGAMVQLLFQLDCVRVRVRVCTLVF